VSIIHDSEIISYVVDLKSRKIIMHTEHHVSTLVKNIDIIFSDVLVHSFNNELSGSIIFDIDKYDITKFMEDNRGLLEKQKNYCWPMYYDTTEELTNKLLQEQYSYYVISSSYGLSGWILAKSYQIGN